MNEELQRLVENIYIIIDTYYDEKDAMKIANLIELYASHAQKDIIRFCAEKIAKEV